MPRRRQLELGGLAAAGEDAVADVAAAGGDVAELVEELEPAQVGRAEVGRDPDAVGSEAEGEGEQSGDERVGGVLQGRAVTVRVSLERQTAAGRRLAHLQRRCPTVAHEAVLSGPWLTKPRARSGTVRKAPRSCSWRSSHVRRPDPPSAE